MANQDKKKISKLSRSSTKLKVLLNWEHVMPRFFMTGSIRIGRSRRKRRLMEIATFLDWVCCGALAHLESWSILCT